MSRDRVDYIDIYRGIGIIFMVMGHVGFGTIFDKFVHAFNMPMFFFISGYFFNEKRSLKEVLGKLFKKLLIPYLVLGIFYSVICLLTNNRSMILEQLKCLFWSNTELPVGGAIWFLTALFWTELFYSLIINKSRNKYSQRIIKIFIFLLVALGVFGVYKFPIRLPLALDVSLVAIGFYHLGHLLKVNSNPAYIKKILHLNVLWIIIIGLFATFIIYGNGYVNMRTGEYSNIILSFSGSLISIICILNISKIIEKINILKYLNKELRFIGRYSVIYLCFNQFLLMVCLKLENILDFDSDVAIIRFINLIFILGVLHFFCLFFKMNKLKIVFGL